jgi:carboxypeptidase PM20D1
MTVSPTIIQAGVALNVLPQHAVVKVNARLLPGQTQEDLVKYMQSSVAGWVAQKVIIGCSHAG